jgi:hypothetical protein
MVARQLSVWPFAARTARLFVLVDPSLPDEPLRGGVLRAMQQAYFGSDGYSQTRAVREAALAAHYVLRHNNRDALPLSHLNAASALAALRGNVAYVALAGNAAAFAWRDGDLTGQRGAPRQPRPLGLEQDPLIILWSTPLQAGDRLVLVCGATWQHDFDCLIREILSSTSSAAVAEQQLAEALGDGRPAAVSVITSTSTSPRVPHLRLVATNERADGSQIRREAPASGQIWRWLFGALGLILLGLVALAALLLTHKPAAAADRVDFIRPEMAVRLGPSAASVVDLAVGDSALYTLDVTESAVRAFELNRLEQQATPETLLAQSGTPLDSAGRRLAAPVAIEYVPGPDSQPGSLTIVDQLRTVAQVGPDRSLSARSVPTAINWQELGALGFNVAGRLMFLDSGARQLLEYPALTDPVLDPPVLVLNADNAPRLSFNRVAQVIGTGESVVLRLDDGTVHCLDAGGADRVLTLPPGDGRVPLVSAIASDATGALYVADTNNARIVQMTVDGAELRQLRAPALAGVRAMGLSLDGVRLYALVGSGILVFDIPAL